MKKKKKESEVGPGFYLAKEEEGGRKTSTIALEKMRLKSRAKSSGEAYCRFSIFAFIFSIDIGVLMIWRAPHQNIENANGLPVHI
jgi:hypothetical protein